ncbi:hypothetical protein ACWEKT_40810 [Nocardia takedensis]
MATTVHTPPTRNEHNDSGVGAQPSAYLLVCVWMVCIAVASLLLAVL